MEKIKTTASAIRKSSGKIVCAGYCDLQELLKDTRPVAYTSGIYGWNFDVYDVYGVTITTGYRGMVGRRANNIDAYEKRAREINCKYRFTDYDKRREELSALLKEFCEQA